MLSCLLYPLLGRDFFPSVDAGQIRLHMRAPTGTRIEETARLADEVEAAIREIVPPDQLETILDNLGVPNSGINLSYSNAGTIGTLDGEILLSLRDGPSPDGGVRLGAARRAAEAISRHRILFPARRHRHADPELRAAGRDRRAVHRRRPRRRTRRLPRSSLKEIRGIPGAVDAHVHQRMDGPILDLQMDRTRLQQFGLTAFNVGQNVLVSLSGSSQTAPAFWLNPQNGVVYNIAVQTPQYQRRFARHVAQHAGRGHRAQRRPTPTRSSSAIWSRSSRVASSRSRRATTSRRPSTSTSACRAPISPTSPARCRKLVDKIRPKLPRGSQVAIRGQVQTMQASFIGLGVGLAMAIVLVYLLIVVNFQSWIDAAIIIAALPAALAGIAWMLFLTGTTLSVPALTGAIMTMGVATANSILVVAFARQRLEAASHR